MKFAKVKASENIIDQYNTIRLIKGNKYLIIDETGQNACFDIRYFEN